MCSFKCHSNLVVTVHNVDTASAKNVGKCLQKIGDDLNDQQSQRCIAEANRESLVLIRDYARFLVLFAGQMMKMC